MAMAQQVKEVLPHVPLEVIRTDLGEQGCGSHHFLWSERRNFVLTALEHIGSQFGVSLFVPLSPQSKPTVWTPPLPTCWRGEFPSSLRVKRLETCLPRLPPRLQLLLASRALWLPLLPRYFGVVCACSGGSCSGLARDMEHQLGMPGPSRATKELSCVSCLF